MTNSQPPLSPNSAAAPASPAPKWPSMAATTTSSFQPIDVAPPPANPPPGPPSTDAFPPFPLLAVPPLSPASPYSTASASTTAHWSPAASSTASMPIAPDLSASPPLSPAMSQGSGPTRRIVPPSQQKQQRPQPNGPSRPADNGIQDLFIERTVSDSYRLQSAKHRSLELLGAHTASVEEPTSQPQATTRITSDPSDSRIDLYWTPDKNTDYDNVDSSNKDNKNKDGVSQQGFMARNFSESLRMQESKSKSLALLDTYAHSSPNYKARVVGEAFSGQGHQLFDQQQNMRRKNMHMLASSTRKKKPESGKAEETVASLKCQVDIDREKAAERKALLLLDVMAMF